MTFTGQNIRKLTGQKSMSFLLEDCSVDNLTGSGEFGFSDQGSNTIKFKFEQGDILDFDDVNIFSYTEGKTFTISGDISETTYSYRINDISVAEGIDKSDFELKEFFINTTNCDINTNLKIYADETLYSIDMPSAAEEGSTFDITINNSSSDSTIYVFAASLDAASSSELSVGSFTAPLVINPDSSNSISLTSSSSNLTLNMPMDVELTLHTNIGTIIKYLNVEITAAPEISATNSLTLVSETDTETGKEFLYKFFSSVYKYDYSSMDESGPLTQQSTISLEYVSGDIGNFYETLGVDISNGGSGYVTPEVVFGSQTFPNITTTGTASETSGVIDSVEITNIGSVYSAVPTVTFSDAGGQGSSAVGTAVTSSYDKTFTNCFDMGVSTITENMTIDFLSQGLTQDEGDASYPHSTFGKGMYKQDQPTDLTQLADTCYIKIIYTDKRDYHPISIKLKVESLYPDTDSDQTIEEETIDITETI